MKMEKYLLYLKILLIDLRISIEFQNDSFKVENVKS